MIRVDVQPSPSTIVRCVQSPHHAPALVVTDGPTTVAFRPGADVVALGHAAEFAQTMAEAADRWSDACAELARPSRGRPYLR